MQRQALSEMRVILASLVLVASAIFLAIYKQSTTARNDIIDIAALAIVAFITVAIIFSLTPWNRSITNSLVACVIITMTLQVLYEPFGHMWHAAEALLSSAAAGEYEVTWRRALLIPHIVLALASTFLGPLLLLRGYRSAYPAHHRAIGKVYVFGTLLSGVLVLPLAITNAGGIAGQIGFTTMAVSWTSFTWLAYTAIRHRDFSAHRRWMLRSYALTFAFVHVNFTYPFFDLYAMFEVGPVGAKVMQSMLSWIPNLVLVEFYLAATSASGKFLGWKRWWQNLQSLDYLSGVYWTVDSSRASKAPAADESRITP